MYKALRFTLVSLLMMVCGTAFAADVTDELTLSTFGVTGTNYTAVTDISATSSAVYSAQMAGGNDAIQLRSNNSNSGIVTTTSGGKVKSIKVEWNSNTADARTLDVYGKSSAYSAPSDLYNAGNQGTKIASFTKSDGDKEITIDDSYEFIGFRSNSGAMYINKITIVWEAAGGENPPAPTIATPTITPNGGSFLGTQAVTLSCETEGASIYYTLDGSDPTNASALYESPFNITETTTVKVIAIKESAVSAIATATFTAIPSYSTIVALNALENNATFAFTGEALIVAKPTAKHVFVQDATGSSLIYNNGGTLTEAAAVGKTIAANWTGKVSIYKKLFELVPDKAIVVKDGDAVSVSYPEATAADLTADNVNKVVTLKGITSYTIDGKNITIKIGETEVVGYNQFGIELADAVEGKTYQMVGAISRYNDKIQFQPISCEAEAPVESELMKEAKTLAADADAVAVGKLLAAIEAAEQSGDESNLQAAIDQFKTDNADVEKDETAKVATDGWKKFEGNEPAGVCATQFAPAITTYDGRTANLAENYETTVATTGQIIYQDITGLANGSYKVGFYGNAFYTSDRGFESTMEDGADDVAYVFANDQKEFITARVATSTTENNFRQFDVQVTDGTIKLGMGKDKPGTNWHTMQIYQLTWFTTAKEAYAAVKADMTAAVAAAKTLAADANKTEGKEAFATAIADAEAALASNMLTVAELEAEVTKIKEATETFKKANYYIDFAEGAYYVIDAESGKMMAAGHDWGTRGIVNEIGLDLNIAINTEKRMVTFDSQVFNKDSHFLGSNLYMDSPAAEWALEYQGFGFYITNGTQYINIDADDNLALSDTPREWIIVSSEGVLKQRLEEMAKATVENPVDATFLIQGANFNRNDQRNNAWTVSEDCSNKNLSGGNSTNNCAESFHSTFTISQILNNAPKGLYKMTAQGFYRQDGETAETAPVFFIGDKTAEVPVKTGEEDNMSAASASFTSGLYTIDSIDYEFFGDELVVGIKNETAASQWIIFDNFRLTYYGVTPLMTAKQELKAAIANAKAIETTDKQGAEALATAITDAETALNATDATVETLAAAKEALAQAISVFNKANLDADLVEIAQNQGKDLDTNPRATFAEGEGYNTYTATEDLSVAFKMFDIDVKDCDYVVVKFAEPVAAGWNLAFWGKNDLSTVAVPAGATEFKYVFADDEKCAIANDVLPQICMLTLWGAEKPLVAKVEGIYKHQIPVEITRWDFTNWSEETVANLKADAANSKVTGWSDVEKQADAEADVEPTEASKDNCFWAAIAEGGELTANGVVIEELKGLKFNSAYSAKRSLAIAVNYPSTSLGDYAGPSYLWLGGGGKNIIDCFTIPAVKGGSIIKMGVESHKPADARGVKLFVDGTELTDPMGNAVAAPKAYTEQFWQVPVGDAVNVVVQNTNGCHIYFIDLNAAEEYQTAISTVKSNNNLNGTIYNLNGQKMNKAQKGLYIINGKKVVVK